MGLLKLCLYVARDAAHWWQEAVSEQLIKAGFTRGAAFPEVSHHPQRGLYTIVHRDDYMSCGSAKNLAWPKDQLEARFDIKTQLIGHDKDSTQKRKLLNRVIHTTSQGFEIEADPRNAELIVESLNIQEHQDCSNIRHS